MHRNPKFLASLAVVALAIGITGAAFAAWSSTGQGTGEAKSTKDLTSSITGVTPVVADNLYPGAVKTAKVTINNPNPYPIEVTAIQAGSSRAVGTPACPEDSVRTDAVSNEGNAIVKDGGGTVIGPSPATAVYTLTLRMANDAHDNCKSQSFTIGDRADAEELMTATIRSAADTTGNGF